MAVGNGPAVPIRPRGDVVGSGRGGSPAARGQPGRSAEGMGRKRARRADQAEAPQAHPRGGESTSESRLGFARGAGARARVRRV